VLSVLGVNAVLNVLGVVSVFSVLGVLSVLSISNIPGFDSIDVYRNAFLIFNISGGCRIATNSQRHKSLHIATDQVAP
jgi:hypothetical protein